MPIVDVEENIMRLEKNIEQMTQEVFRLQGMLQTFRGFQKGGLKTIDLPNDPNKPTDVPVEKSKQSVTNDILSTLASNPALVGAALSAMNNQSTEAPA